MLKPHQHKNRSGLFVEETGSTDLFIEGLHIDHVFLNERKTPPSLGTFAFALCAITAHLAGLGHISLIAAGGRGFSPRHIGFKVWPKVGFDAVVGDNYLGRRIAASKMLLVLTRCLT